MIICTNPPGAMCYVDDNPVGLTPVPVSPIYYGNRKIRLVKDGFETREFLQSVPPPWYEIPPLDFISENLVPGRICDERTYDFQMDQQRVVPQEELLTRAEELRRGTQTATGVATPGYRVNPQSGQTYVPAPGTPGGPPIGGQPYYQLPPSADRGALPEYPAPAGPAMPTGPMIYGPPPGAAGPPAGPFYSPSPSMPSGPIGPVGPSNFGSQPYHPLP